MPENQVKLIHVFMHKHIKQLVLQTSHNSISIHYKCRRLHCEKTNEDHEANLNHAFLRAKYCRLISIPDIFSSFLISISALPVLFKFEIPIRQREIDVCSAEFTVEELVWCTEPTQNCQGRQTACLLADASWDITTHVTANGPHPLCVCVCVIRPLTFMWPDLSLSSSFLCLSRSSYIPTFCHFNTICPPSSLLHTPVAHTHTHTHTHMQMLKQRKPLR